MNVLVDMSLDLLATRADEVADPAEVVGASDGGGGALAFYVAKAEDAAARAALAS